MTSGPAHPPMLLTARELRRIGRADALASERHQGQVRPHDGTPFIEHPREVASLLAREGADADLIVAGLLHDVVEKTPTDPAEIRAAFGDGVARLVASITADAALTDTAARLADLRARAAAGGVPSGLLFAADRVSKLPELLVDVSTTRAEHELLSIELLEQVIPRSRLLQRLRDGVAAAGIGR